MYELVPSISPDEIQERVGELAGRLNLDYEGRSVVLIGILKGAFVFLADLIRDLTFPLKVDFVRLASYGQKAETCGTVQITKDIELPIRGADVLVVEDIVDTGTTLAWYVEHLRKYGPSSIKTCVLIDKAERRQVDIAVDYACFRIDKGFIVGYGLDFSENHRNLPGIYEVEFLKQEPETGGLLKGKDGCR